MKSLKFDIEKLKIFGFYFLLLLLCIASVLRANNYDYDNCDDLSLLTTGHRPTVNQYSTIYGTSSATAQAANFCAKLYSEYSTIWPETVRALLVHSASWTEQMHRQFCPKGANTNKTQRRDK